MKKILNYCEKCGSSLEKQDSFCQGCGHPFAMAEVDARDEETGYAVGKGGSISWETQISLLTNPLVVKQFVMAILFSGLFMALFLSFLLLVTGEPEGIPGILVGTLIAVSVLGVLMLLAILLVFRGRFQVRFTVDHKGVLWETIDKRAKTGSRLAVVLGILGRSLPAAGAGTLAMSREKEFVSWKEMNRAEYNQNQTMITLRNSWRPVMMLVCTTDNYDMVVDFVKGKFQTTEEAEALSQKRKSPLPKLLFRTFLVLLASAQVFLLPYPFDMDIFIPLLMLLFALATVWLVPFMGYVVIGCAFFIALEILLISLEVKESMFSSLGTYHNYEIFSGDDWFVLFLAFAGLAYLVWFSWRSIRGKILPALFED
ncbi:zinc ribbon domain-containing protein [Candidatus Contubernalis alkaliaceticus]|uniref:zinc ribbon domain-containing protein n=1 Tax=Candidatus Contubernalis alkaliaceticus TaxID=338645 RepID=UPI001F4C184C|nr:zinc ribbon domain-containing protein [Candidatus Contubernalis alkalaceticus]UNC91017.1 zinc ribbon domain-containing protein [Candidatus Contubernalis alkalaceticus]